MLLRRAIFMAHVNENYLKLPGNYLFATIAKKVDAYAAAHPDANIIRLGIGDVTRPLAPAIIEAMHKAVDEMASASTFRGYGPEQGYDFLRNAIIKGDYETRGIHLDTDEIFIGDGAKTDVAYIQQIFGSDLKFAVADPVYPVYLDSNVMMGHTGDWNADKGVYDGVVYLPCTPENGFKAEPPTEKVDIVYLCNPSNPTGTAMTKAELENWVRAAKKNNFVIIYDSAYETYITEPDVPHSIFEIEGAKEVAVELRSYSKCAGFTGTRCSYVIVPKAANAYTADGKAIALNPLWNRRQCTFFNGTPYIVQRAAEAYYSPEGQKQCLADVKYYMENAHIIRDGLTQAGYTVYGATNSPYAWVQTPTGLKSWDFFDLLLDKAQVVTTPGTGFGPHGEGYMRLTAFGSKENTIEAVQRIANLKIIK
jgi:LL-diaminopimelate aminotransferase